MCTGSWMTGINHTEANLRTWDGKDMRESSMSRSMEQETCRTGGEKGRLASNQREPEIP